MPSTDLVERLHERLIHLGDEPAVAAERGEAIEPPIRPESKIDDDLSALLGDAVTEGAEEPADPFADVSLGDDDFPVPSDYSFDPDAIPDTLDEEASPLDEPSFEEDASEADDFGVADSDTEDFGIGPDELGALTQEIETEDLAQIPDMEEVPSAADDDFATDDFGLGDETEIPDIDDEFSVLDDLAELESATAAPPAADEFGTDDFATDDFGADEFGTDDFDAGDFDAALPDLNEGFGGEESLPAGDQIEADQTELDQTEPEQIEAEQTGDEDFGDLGDFGTGESTDEFGVADDDDFAGLTDLEEEPQDLGADTGTSVGELGTDEFGIVESDEGGGGFGPDFGTKVDAEFGDIDLDEDSISADPFADATTDAFELPAVEDSIDGLAEEGFNLGDFGEAFDIDEESMDDFAGLDTGVVEEAGEEAPEEAATVDLSEKSYSDEEFTRIRETLGSLPLNVKIAVEECIGETKGPPAEILELIALLIKGESPQTIAAQVSKTTGTTVQVPRGYQRRTGLAFEEEKRSFRYQFVHVILPVLRLAAILTVAAAVVGISLYRFVYQPVYAGILYRRGYEDIQEERYDIAEETFVRAYNLRPRDKWFSEYARAFVDKREYQRAVLKYDQLVFGMNPDMRRFVRDRLADLETAADRLGDLVEFTDPENPRSTYRGRLYDLINVDRPAILEHAELQSSVLANYRRAEELLIILLYRDAYDAEALLARGDNFFRWAQTEPERLRDSYEAFDRYTLAHGPTDEVLMRFLRHFVARDNRQEVLRIVQDVQSRRDSRVDARIYANAANYLLEDILAGEAGGLGAVAAAPMIDIQTMLIKAYETNPLQPEVQYVDAKNRRRLGDVSGERAALDEAQRLFELAEPLEPDQLEQQIDTDILSGEYFLRYDEILTADGEFERARRRYDRAKEAGLLDPDPEIARVYESLGDILYYNGGDLGDALDYFDRAVADGRSNNRLDYKRGFVHYERQEYDDAIELFLDAWQGNGFDAPENVLYARANTLFRRGVYQSAEAYYRELLDKLYDRRASIRTLLIEEKPEEQALIEMMYKVENNLGVTLSRLASRGADRDARLQAESLVHLQQSTELFENYLRDPDSGVRAEARSLAFLNLRSALYPRNDDDRFETFDLQIHERIPRDEEQLFF